jgi:hypothetical protein
MAAGFSPRSPKIQWGPPRAPPLSERRWITGPPTVSRMRLGDATVPSPGAADSCVHLEWRRLLNRRGLGTMGRAPEPGCNLKGTMACAPGAESRARSQKRLARLPWRRGLLTPPAPGRWPTVAEALKDRRGPTREQAPLAAPSRPEPRPAAAAAGGRCRRMQRPPGPGGEGAQYAVSGGMRSRARFHALRDYC